MGDEERRDAKADKAQAHSNLLRHDREKALSKIKNYQRQIDHYTTDITYFEKRIDELRCKTKAQLGDMRAKQQEAINLRHEANCLKREADLNCNPGIVEREFHGLNRNSRQKEIEKNKIQEEQKVAELGE